MAAKAQFTVRAFIRGKDRRLDEICRVFSSMERTAYNLLREGANASTIKATLRKRYGIRNARWIQSTINQARAVMWSQEESIEYRIEMCKEKIKNTKKGMKSVSNPLKIHGYKVKIAYLQARIDELRMQLREASYPRAIFGSKELLRKLRLSRNTVRYQELREQWRKRRSDHFFSVGQANVKGNGNTRLECGDNGFHLEIRNWFDSDFKLGLCVPEVYKDIAKSVIEKAEAIRLGKRGELVDGEEGIPYSVRVIIGGDGYQVLISFELEEPSVDWNGRLAGIDLNPEAIACTVTSRDGNLLASRFLRDNRLISASKNKRKWVLENLINKMLRWCRDTHGCNAIAIEDLRFKGAYDFDSTTNLSLSNFMMRKILDTIKLHALKMDMLTVEVNPAYTSKVAFEKYSKELGGFNRHQLAAFLIARRALGFGEAPTESCLPKTRKERSMWNHCIMYYGYSPQIQTLLQREPMEWKSADDVNGGGEVTELLRAPPASTSGRRLSHAPMGALNTRKEASRRTGRVHPNRHTIGGDGARGHRVNPPGSRMNLSAIIFMDKEDNDVC